MAAARPVILAVAALLVASAAADNVKPGLTGNDPNAVYSASPLLFDTGNDNVPLQKISRGSNLRLQFQASDALGRLVTSPSTDMIRLFRMKLGLGLTRIAADPKGSGIQVVRKSTKSCKTVAGSAVPVDQALLVAAPSVALTFDATNNTYIVDVPFTKPGCFMVYVWWFSSMQLKGAVLVA